MKRIAICLLGMALCFAPAAQAQNPARPANKAQKNTDTAASMLERAEKGDAQAQFEVGFRHIVGRDGFAKNPQEAMKWLRKSAEQGYAEGQYFYSSQIVLTARTVEEMSASTPWLRKAAEQGYPAAQRGLGLLYEGGILGVPEDLKLAEQWYQKAAAQGDKKAVEALKALKEK